MTNHHNTSSKEQHQRLTSFKLLILVFAFSLSTLTVANSILAVIDDDVITSDTIANQIKTTTTKAEKKALVNQQIDLVLQLKQAEKFGIRPKPKTINTILNRIASQNKITFAQLKESPEFDIIVENVTQNLLLTGLKQFIFQGIEINLTQAEIDKAIAKNRAKNDNLGKQIKIAQILISSIKQKPDNTSTQSKNELIKQFLIELTSKINNGTSFASLAKLYSEDPSYKNGGESTWLDLAKLPTVIKQQLSKLKIGQISKPFITKKGWRIIKITEQRDTIKNQPSSIKKQLIKSQKETYFKNWIKNLRKGVYIEIFEHKL